MSRAPYKYFDYYTSADADLFFGREKETQMMVGEILSSRLLVLFARSGSGKTSLINAGVIPELKRLGYETLYVRFESDPLTSLQNAAAEQLQLTGAANIVAQASLPADKMSALHPIDLRGLLQNVTVNLKKPLVVFLDQFEEFFLVFADQPALRQDFIAQVAAVKYDDQLPVFLVLSLREDYYANLHEFRSAMPSIFQNNANIRLGAFSDEEARRAILNPLTTVGLQMETGLAERIIRDLKQSEKGRTVGEAGSSGIEPITLQIVCHKLWQMKPKDADTITAAVYEKCGGAQKVLRNHISELLQNIPQREQSFIVRIFEALKTRDNTKLYRRVQELQETLRLRDANRLQAALQKLTEIGVLRHEQRSGDDWYEFKHDYLVPEMTKWIQARREMVNRRSFWFGIAPGVVLFWGLLTFLIIQYNTFYASILVAEDSMQYEEIAVFREFNPMEEIISTGLKSDDLRDKKAANELWDDVKLGLGEDKDWSWLIKRLDLVRSGEILYKLGYIRAGFDSLLFALRSKDESIRSKAISALTNLGANDEKAFEMLLSAMRNSDKNYNAQVIEALGASGKSFKQFADTLLIAIKDKDRNVRFQVIKALGGLHPNNRIISERIRVALLSAIHDESWSVRSQAVKAIGNLQKVDARILEALLLALKDQTKEVRSQAAEVLSNMLENDARVMRSLLDALKDQDRDVRAQAVQTLGNWGKNNVQIIEAMLLAIQDESWEVRAKAAHALGKLGGSNERVIDALLVSVKDEIEEVRTEALTALGKIEIKKSSDRVIEAAFEAIKDGNTEDFISGVSMLATMAVNDERVADLLLNTAKDQNENIRSGAILVLAYLQRVDKQSIDTLLKALKDRNEAVRFLAAFALVIFEKKGESQAIDTLLVTIRNQEKNIRSSSVQAFGYLRKINQPVSAALVEALEDQDGEVRAEAASALGKVMQRDKRIFAKLITRLKDNDSGVRREAGISLGQWENLKPTSQLLKQLTHNLSGYRTAAAYGLTRKNLPGDSTLRVINNLKQDERPWVRLAAWEFHELLEKRRKSLREGFRLLHEGDSLLTKGNWQTASIKYESSFNKYPEVTYTDSLNSALAKFQQARCTVLLKRKSEALEHLQTAFEYNPALRDTLRAEMSQPENDWKILEGNWYLRDVLLKKE